jgi:four helix bundle protein
LDREVGMEETLKRRMKDFALAVIRVVDRLPKGQVPEIIGKQLVRSATSVGANYRAACRGRSKPDFIFKLGMRKKKQTRASTGLNYSASLS